MTRRLGVLAGACLVIVAATWTALPVAGWGATAFAQDAVPHASSRPPLVFLADQNYPPLSYVEDGIVAGIDVDIAHSLSRILDRDIRVEATDWSNAQQRVLRGEADGLLSMSITEERRALYDFTEPIITHEFAIFVRAGDPAVRTIVDLTGKRVAVTPAGLPRRLLESGSAASIVIVDEYNDGFARLVAGTVDAVAADQWVGAYTIERQGLRNIVRGGAPFATLSGAIAVTKGNRALLDEINRAIRAIHTDGTLEGILKRWRPTEVVFVTRQRMQWMLAIVGTGFAALMLLGGVALRKQRRVERRMTLLAQALQSANDCITITDPSEQILYANEAFLRTYEFEEREVIGQHIDIVRAADNPRVVLDAIHTQTFDGEGWRGVIRNRTKSGRVLRVSLSTSTVKDERGRTIAAVGVARDRTSEEAAEAALRASEEKYREVVERARDVIFTVDREGYCTSMNMAGRVISGFTSDSSRGVHLAHLVVPDQADVAVTQLSKVLAGQTVPRFEIDILSRVGKRLTLELDVHPIWLGSVIVGAQGIARDVSTRKELEAQLLQAQKMEAVGRLAGGIAHDFNNVLTVITACAELAGGTIEPASQAHYDLEQIQHAAASAASLTRQLLIFSRKSVVVPTIVDLNDALRRLDRMLRRLVGPDIEFMLRTASNAGHIEVDVTQLEQVVMNLFVNARDAMPRGGSLAIHTGLATVDDAFRDVHRLRTTGEFATLTVSDTGLGMSPEIRAHIFDPFFTTKDASVGTGLGLATVDGIVRQAGGCVVVESAIGVGSSFTIYLPQVAPTRAAATKAAAVAHSRSSGTILFVEDDDAVRAVAARALRTHGYTVLTARHARAAMHMFEAHGGSVDLLLTDLAISGHNGSSLPTALRRSEPRLKVLLTSGYVDADTAHHGVQAEADAVLQKPYAIDDLLRQVGQLLGGGLVDYAAQGEEDR